MKKWKAKLGVILISLVLMAGGTACNGRGAGNEGGQGAGASQDQEGEQAPVGQQETKEAQQAEDPANGNTNFSSSFGKFLYCNGYTYFWDHALDNDASGNGIEDSINLYRIAEAADAKEEQIAVFPCPVEVGTTQDFAPMQLLGGYGDRIYYLSEMETDGKAFSLKWISTNGANQGEVDLGLGEKEIWQYSATTAGTHVYCNVTWIERDAESERMGSTLYDINLADETVKPVSIATSPCVPVAVDESYVYLLRYRTDEEGKIRMGDNGPEMINGLYRENRTTGELEEVAPVDAGLLSTVKRTGRFIELTDDYLYYQAENDLRAVRLSDGADLEILAGCIEDPYLGFNITKDTIYYTNWEENGLYTCALDGTEKQKWLPGSKDKAVTRMAVSDAWIYYYLDEPGGWGRTCRVSRNAKFFTHEAIGSPYVYVETKTSTEGDWSYRAYRKYAEIIGYSGTETSITIPETIGGLPVYSVTSDAWGSDAQWSDVREITFPACIKTIGVVYEPGLETVHLPAGDLIFRHRDIAHTFWNGGNHLDIYYAGTLAEWEHATELGLRMYGSGGIEWNAMESDFTVHCADGDVVE